MLTCEGYQRVRMGFFARYLGVGIVKSVGYQAVRMVMLVGYQGVHMVMFVGYRGLDLW